MNDKTQAVVLDVQAPLEAFLNRLSACTDTPNEICVKEIFLTSIRYLHYENNARQAIESLMVEMTDLYHTGDVESITNKNIFELDRACADFISQLHRQLCISNMYDNGELCYTFGGWIYPACPFMIPIASIPKFSKSIPLVVESQYEDPRNYPDIDRHHWNPAHYLTTVAKHADRAPPPPVGTFVISGMDSSFEVTW